MYPAIPENRKATLKIKKGDSNKDWLVGITKEELEKTKNIWLGKNKKDWSFRYDGFTWNNDIKAKFAEVLDKEETVTVVVDRVKGTVGFIFERGGYK